MKSTEFILGLCPMCGYYNLVAIRQQLGKRKTQLIITCEGCDLYPDEVLRGCSHLGPENNPKFTQEHDKEGHAVMIKFTAMKNLPPDTFEEKNVPRK